MSFDPASLLDEILLRGRYSERKTMLLACACCRRIWNHLHKLSQNAVEVTERFADGNASELERLQMEESLQEFVSGWVYPSNNTWADDARCFSGALAAIQISAESSNGPLDALKSSLVHAAFAIGPKTASSTQERCEPESRRQVEILRCIFGNPFHPVHWDIDWRTPAVLQLARSMYDTRTFDDMPKLAGLLQRRGCQDQQLLDHCRTRGPHARGCWVIDLLLNRE